MTDGPAKPIGQHLQLAARLHRARIAQAIQDLGLFPGQEQVLIALTNKQAGTVGELAALLRVRPPTISKTLQRLTQQGLIERSDHDNDARKSRIDLTKEGTRRANELEKRMDGVEAKLADDLDGKDLRRLRKTLKRVIRSLGEGFAATDEDGDDV